MMPARFLRWSRSLIGNQHRKFVLQGVWWIFGLPLFFWILSTWLDVQMLVNALPPRQFPDAEGLTNLLWAFALSGVAGLISVVAGCFLCRAGSRMAHLISAVALLAAFLVWD